LNWELDDAFEKIDGRQVAGGYVRKRIEEKKRGAPHVGFTCGDFDFIAPEFFFASGLIEAA